MRRLARLLMFAVPLTVMAGTLPALAEDRGGGDDGHRMPAEEKLVLQKLIDVGGVGLGAFDISFVDPTIQLYILADRTNASVDLFDSEDATFTGRIGAKWPA